MTSAKDPSPPKQNSIKKNKTEVIIENGDDIIEDSYSWEAAQSLKKQKPANPLDLFQQQLNQNENKAAGKEENVPFWVKKTQAATKPQEQSKPK